MHVEEGRVGRQGGERHAIQPQKCSTTPPAPPGPKPLLHDINQTQSLTHTVCSSSPPTLPALYIKEKKFFLTTVTATLEPLD